MSKQWMVVLGVIAGLAAGAYALVRFGPENTGVEIGKKAPDYRLVDLATGDSVSLRTLAKGDVALVNIITDRTSGESKGFGFVTMSAQSEADKAISMFNTYSLSDHELKVDLAKPREQRGFGSTN